MLRAIGLAATLFAVPAAAAELTVEVTALDSDDGDVHIALYDDANAFPDSDGMLAERRVLIADRRAGTTFQALPPGTYAVAVYHDENGNHSFDQGFLGIPLESYGFSSGARAFFGPPSFAAAAFEVGGTRKVVTIRLND